MLETQTFSTGLAGVLVNFSKFSITFLSLTRLNFLNILLVIFLTIHCLMYLEILIHTQIKVHIENLIAKWTGINFLILLLVTLTTMRFYRVMICTENFTTVFTVNWEPVFLFTCLILTMLTDIVIVHLIIF